MCPNVSAFRLINATESTTFRKNSWPVTDAIARTHTHARAYIGQNVEDTASRFITQPVNRKNARTSNANDIVRIISIGSSHPKHTHRAAAAKIKQCGQQY